MIDIILSRKVVNWTWHQPSLHLTIVLRCSLHLNMWSWRLTNLIGINLKPIWILNRNRILFLIHYFNRQSFILNLVLSKGTLIVGQSSFECSLHHSWSWSCTNLIVKILVLNGHESFWVRKVHCCFRFNHEIRPTHFGDVVQDSYLLSRSVAWSLSWHVICIVTIDICFSVVVRTYLICLVFRWSSFGIFGFVILLLGIVILLNRWFFLSSFAVLSTRCS